MIMTLNEKEMAQIATKNGDENFMAIATTPWHAHGIDACILLLQKKRICLKGTIFICTLRGQKKCLAPNDFAVVKSENVDIDFVECDYCEYSVKKKIISNIKALKIMNKKCETKDFYIINELFPNFNWICELFYISRDLRPIYYLVDEGCGTYISNGVKEWTMLKMQSYVSKRKKMLLTPIIYFIGLFREMLKKLGVYYLKKKGRYHKCSLFVEKNNKLVKNMPIIELYREVFDRLHHRRIDMHYMLDEVILLNTQPLMEDGYIDDDNAIWKKVIDIVSLYSKDIVVKPHPRESLIKKYSLSENIRFCNIPISQELLISESNLPKCIISPFSTTLITLNLFWNVPAISLAKMYLKHINNKTRRNIILNFISTFNDFIYFPENEEEFKSVLNNFLSDKN